MKVFFNINDTVKVKLTEDGKETLINHHRRLKANIERHTNIPEPTVDLDKLLKTDEEGYQSFQIWNLMNIFGSETRMGVNAQFIKNEMLLEGMRI
jgi:hypothetical protein